LRDNFPILLFRSETKGYSFYKDRKPRELPFPPKFFAVTITPKEAVLISFLVGLSSRNSLRDSFISRANYDLLSLSPALLGRAWKLQTDEEYLLGYGKFRLLPTIPRYVKGDFMGQGRVNLGSIPLHKTLHQFTAGLSILELNVVMLGKVWSLNLSPSQIFRLPEFRILR